MEEDRKPERTKTARNALSFITVGLQLAITILIFIYAGYRLDLYYDRSPVFVTIGAVVGMGLGFYHLIKQLQDIDKSEKRDQNRKRNRWL